MRRVLMRTAVLTALLTCESFGQTPSGTVVGTSIGYIATAALYRRLYGLRTCRDGKRK